MGFTCENDDKIECLIEPEPKQEDILDEVKGDGPWQRRVNFVLILFSIPAHMHNMSITFFAPNIDYWCARPDGSNMTVKEWKHIGLPSHDHKCSRYNDSYWNMPHESRFNFSLDRSTYEACQAWEFDHTEYASTAIEEWNLVCGHEWYVSLSKSVFTLGFMLTVFTSGQLADKYGRKPIIAIYNFIGLVSSLLCAFSSSYFIFNVCRFFIAVGVIAAETVGFVLRMEIVGAEYRTFYGCVGSLGFFFGGMLLLFLAYLIRDWFWIQIAITVANFLLIFCWWCMPESPRWLLANRKVDEALDVLMKAGTENKLNMRNKEEKLRELLMNANKTEETSDNSANMLLLFREPRIRNQTLILYFIWFAVAFVSYGLMFNTNDMAGDPWLNFAAFTFVDIPSAVIALVAMHYKGRKYPLAISYLIGGAACLLSYFIPNERWLLNTFVLLVGKLFMGACFTMVYIFTSELMPTVLRNSGLGSASMVARIGNILAPFVRELGNATHPYVGPLIFGALSVIAGLLVLLLPETSHCKMPDTLEEASEMSRTNRLKSYRIKLQDITD